MARILNSSPLLVLLVLLGLSMSVQALYTDSRDLLKRQEEDEPTSTSRSSTGPASSSPTSRSSTSAPVSSSVTQSTTTQVSTISATSTEVSSIRVPISSPSASSTVPSSSAPVPSSRSTVTLITASEERVQPTDPATTLVLGDLTTFVTSTRSNPAGLAPTIAGAAADTSDPFWDNKGAVGGTFGAVGLVGAGIMAAIIVGMVRRQRQRKEHEREIAGAWRDHKPSDDPFIGASTRQPHYQTHGARSPSVSEMVRRSPMDAYGSRDPFSDPHQVAAYRPYVAEAPGTPSVYSQNLAGQGTVMDAQGLPYASYRNDVDGDPGLVPPSPSRDVHRASYDSFYGAHTAHQGQAL